MEILSEKEILSILEIEKNKLIAKGNQIKEFAESKGLTCSVHESSTFRNTVKNLYPKLSQFCAIDWQDLERVAKGLALVSLYYDSFTTKDINLEVINYKTSTLKLSQYDADLRFILADLKIVHLFWEISKHYKNGSVEITFTNAEMFNKVLDKIFYKDPRTDKVVDAINEEEIKKCKQSSYDYSCYRAMKMREVLEDIDEDHHINWNRIDIAFKKIKIIK